MNKQTVWQNYIASGIVQFTSDSQKQKINFINIFSLVGICSTFIFGIVHIYAGILLVGIVEALIGVICLLNILSLRQTKNITAAGSVILFCMMMLSCLFLTSGGYMNTGIYWLYTFPLLAFFLKGKKVGLYWVLAFLLEVIVITIIGTFTITDLAFTFVQIRQFIFSFIAVSLLVYFYEVYEEKNIVNLEETSSHFLENNQKVQKMLLESAKTKEKLEKIVSESTDIKRAVLNILEDLQEEKNKLNSLSDRYTLATEAASVGVWEWDVVTDTLIANKKFYSMYSAQESDFAKAYSGWEKFLHPDDKQKVIDIFRDSLASKPTLILTYKINTTDGIVRTLKVISNIQRDEQKKPIKLVGVQIDITHEMEVDQMKSDFISLASHQLRTPLATINWYCEMLLDGDAGQITEEQRKFINEAYVGSRRMTKLVSALLNVSRIETGTYLVEPELVNIVQIIRSVLDENKPQTDEKKLNITLTKEDIPEVMLDPNLITIIVQNLLTNAIKYSFEGGAIQVTVKILKKDTQFKEFPLSEDYILLQVEDNGLGIPNNQKDKIFQKLFRADNVKKTHTDGNGLGLYLVKALIEHDKGKIWFESTPADVGSEQASAHGTTFFVLLPFNGMQKKEGYKKIEQ